MTYNTAKNWLTLGRQPHRRHSTALESLLNGEIPEAGRTGPKGSRHIKRLREENR